MPHQPVVWDAKYEWRAVALLMLGFGLVGLDRFAINPLFPAMMKDLGLTYQDLGNLSSVLAVAWGVASMYMGGVSDRLGRRRVLIPTVLVFSLMAGFTGLANGVAALLVMRVVMGLAEGAFMPASIAATIEASKPSRRGLNFALQQNGMAIVGLALGPILVTQLLAATGSWRLAFAIVALPGLVLAFLMYKVIRDTQGTVGASQLPEPAGEKPNWRDALKIRNVALACLVLMFIAAGLNVIIAMTPSYLVDYLKLETGQMGLVMSATGVGAVIGGVGFSALSDRIGRKPVMMICAVLGVVALWAFTVSPADPLRLFLLLGATFGALSGLTYINNGPLTMESAPAALASTAVGLVVGIGEVIGGGLAPTAAGYIAQHHGINNVFSVSIGCLIACATVVVFVREPPRRNLQLP
jgi:MFS family permease